MLGSPPQSDAGSLGPGALHMATPYRARHAHSRRSLATLENVSDPNRMSDPVASAGAAPGTFRVRILRAGGWTVVGHVGTQFLRLVSNLIMTRLLLPQMFGVMAVANVVLTGLNLVSDLGVSQNIVQHRRGADAAYLNTAWTTQILRGGVIWVGCLLFAAGLKLVDVFHLIGAGTTYAQPGLPALIAGVSFYGLVGGFNSTKIATANRSLALSRLVQIDIYSQLSALCVMVVWALLSPTAWALVGGGIVSSLTRLALSHFFLPGERNRLHWDREAFHDIFSFGKWIFVTSILGFLAANGDRIILGGLVDANTLGVYVIAAFMISAINQIFQRLTNNVAFPALAEVARDRPADLRRTYYKFRAPLDVSSLLATGLLFSAGDLLVRILYNHRYQAAGHMMEILSVGIFEVRYGLVAACMMALGKPRLLAPVIFVQLLVLLLVPPAYHRFGMDGALWVIAASYLCTMPVTFYMKITHGLLDLRKELIVLPCVPIGYFAGIALNKLAELLWLAR